MQTIQLRSSSGPDSKDGPAPQAEAWIDIEAADEEGRRWLASQSGLDDEIIKMIARAGADHLLAPIRSGTLFQYAHRGAWCGHLDDRNHRVRNLAGARPNHQRSPQ